MLAYGFDIADPMPYGVAVEAALEDLRAAAAAGRDVAPALQRAELVGCTPREIAAALDETRLH